MLPSGLSGIYSDLSKGLALMSTARCCIIQVYGSKPNEVHRQVHMPKKKHGLLPVNFKL